MKSTALGEKQVTRVAINNEVNYKSRVSEIYRQTTVLMFHFREGLNLKFKIEKLFRCQFFIKTLNERCNS